MQWNGMKKNRTPLTHPCRAFIWAAGILGCVTLLIPSAFVFADGAAPMKKPQAPIRLQFGTEGAVAVGSEVTVTLTGMPMVSSESATVSILLPEGLTLLDGETGWTGLLEKNQSHVLTIRVRPERAASLEIRAKAVLAMAGGSQMSRHAALMLDLDPNKPKPRLQQRSGPGDSMILEIPAQSRPKNR